MPKTVSREHAFQVCKIGQGKECCRYFMVGAGGFECAKNTKMKKYLDSRVKENSITALGDNCEGGSIC